MFKGSNVALLTPFKNNKLDEDCYIKLINFHIENGTNGLVPAGTTGESPTLSHEEHEKVIELCIKEAKGKIPVIAGTGSNSTITTNQHKKVYINTINQLMIIQACQLLFIIFQVAALLIDATGDLNRLDQTLKKLGPDFIQLTGEDGLAFEFNKRGGVGIISVTANIAPKLCSDFQKFSKSNSDNEIKEAERIDALLQPLHKALFIESNPAPAKYAAKLLGLCSDDVRLPLVKIQESTKEKVKEALLSAKLL